MAAYKYPRIIVASSRMISPQDPQTRAPLIEGAVPTAEPVAQPRAPVVEPSSVGRSPVVAVTHRTRRARVAAWAVVGRCLSSWFRFALWLSAPLRRRSPAAESACNVGPSDDSAFLRPHRPFPMTSNHATTETSLGEAHRQSVVPPTRRPRLTTASVIFERRTSRHLHSHGGHGCRRADPASRLGDPSGPAVMWA
jgi:hypothetical protein